MLKANTHMRHFLVCMLSPCELFQGMACGQCSNLMCMSGKMALVAIGSDTARWAVTAFKDANSGRSNLAVHKGDM